MYQLPVHENAGHFSNLSLIEHPHGGFIAIYSFSLSNKDDNYHYVESHYFDVLSHKWKTIGTPFSCVSNEILDFSQVTYLNFMGNLQTIYSLDHHLKQQFSYDYGKSWKSPIEILEDSVAWQVKKQPIFVKMGRIVLPVFDKASGRSFTYISEDTGKNWFPSVFIEPNDDLIDNQDDLNSAGIQMKNPVLIQAGERKIFCYVQEENQDFLLRAISDDFGETWSYTEQTTIPIGIGVFDLIRLRDANGNFTPNIALIMAFKRNEESFGINLSISNDIGQSWNSFKEIETVNTPITDMTLLQTIENMLHILFCTNSSVYHLIVEV